MLDAPREPGPGLLAPLTPLSSTTETLADLRDAPAANERFWVLRRLRVAAVAVAIVLLALAGDLIALLIGNQVVYTSARTRTGNLAVVVRASGLLTATSYPVDPTVTGTLSSLDVTVGQQVTAGQTLAQINAPALADAVAQGQAAVTSAQTTVADALALQTATQDDVSAANSAAWHEEQSALYACQHPTGATPPNCEAAATARYDAVVAHNAALIAASQASVDAAQTQLTLANGALLAAQHSLDATTLVAPHAGTVEAVTGQVGEPVGPGASGVYASGGPLITIVDLSAMQVLSRVSESEAGQVNAGQAVAFTTPAYPKRVFRGTVSSVAPLASASTSGFTVPVTVEMDMLSGQGMTPATGVPVAVTIYLAQRYNALLVPAAAVTYAHHLLAGVVKPTGKNASANGDAPTYAQVQQARAAANLLAGDALVASVSPTADTSTADVLVVRGARGWVLKPVLLGLSDGRNVIVVAGLKAGEVVTTGQHARAASPFTGSDGTVSATTTGGLPQIFGT